MPQNNNDKAIDSTVNSFECHIKINENNTASAITVLEEYCIGEKKSLTRSELKQAINKGALWLTRAKHTQRLRRVKKTLTHGDKLHFYYNPQVLASKVADAQLISDLTDYSVWYKPYGMLSQGSKWSDHCTISRFAQQNLIPERAVFIVHRLDRAATGLILLAHSKKAARALSSMFEQHNLNKQYQIIVHGDFSKYEQAKEINLEIDGKKARSTFTFLAYNVIKQQSLIQVKIDTGRKHQIRKHAAGIGFPVVGDRLHGRDEDKEQDVIDLQLCAVNLSFTCPISGQEQTIKLPEDLQPKLF